MSLFRRLVTRFAAPIVVPAAPSDTAAANVVPSHCEPVDLDQYPGGIRLACVGDSITYGVGISDRSKRYPARLAGLLGPRWNVQNFGRGGATLMNKGDLPYQQTPEFKQALDFAPHVVVIMLGANDTKPANWKHKADFHADYVELVRRFYALPSRPCVYICYSVPAFGWRQPGVNERGLTEQRPMIDAVARDLGIGVIDAHSPLAGKRTLVPDGVHPNAAGAAVVAAAVCRALTGQAAESASVFQ